MRYILLLLACFVALPPLNTYNSIGVIMPTPQRSEFLDIAARRNELKSFRVIAYLPPDAFATVCSTIS